MPVQPAPLDNVHLPLAAEPHAPQDACAHLLALAWGENENYQNLLESVQPNSRGRDVQGTGILPRANGSFTDAQLSLLDTALAARKGSKAPLVAASHFTLVNFGKEDIRKVPQPLQTDADTRLFGLYDSATGLMYGLPGFNRFNNGACERHLDRFYKKAIFNETRLDWHLSGHSHRAGVYQVAPFSGNLAGLKTEPADPGLCPGRTHTPHEDATALVVSSCGGPVGIQNLNNELRGWTLRPPSGSLIDLATRKVKQIVSTTDMATGLETGRPRLCVALDYMMLMCPGEKTSKGAQDESSDYRFRWTAKKTADLRWPETFQLTLGAAFHRLDCIAGVTLWVFEATKSKKIPKGGTAAQAVKTWHRISLSGLEERSRWQKSFYDGGGATVSFTQEDRALLSRLIADSENRQVLQAFCEVALKKPAAMAEEKWAEDMNCSDPWFFPVEMGIEKGSFLEGDDRRYQPYLRRRVGEFGEVPEWKFWAKYYGEKKKKGGLEYPRPEDVIRPFPDKKP